VRRRVLRPEGNPPPTLGGWDQPLRRLTRAAGTLPELWRLHQAAGGLLGELNPSVIVSNDFRSLAPLTWGKPAGIPKVAYLRGWWTPDMFRPYARRIARRHCAAMLAVSHQTRTSVTCAGIDPRKVHVVHNPIDAEAISERSKGELESPVPGEDRPVRLLLPGTIIRTKGQDTAVRAVRRLVDAGVDAVLWLAGALYEGKLAWQSEVQAIADELGVGDRVHWLDMRPDVPQLMARATAVILPTHTEGHPRTSLEAMALARPFISCPVGGVLDMVLPGVTGWLHEVGDDAGLAECVRDVIDRPDRTARITATARQYVRELFTPERQTDQLLEVLARVARQ
jgi:glycosyltransferase involved in cell wall biosynthesis